MSEEEEEFDFENDDSWYEEAMKAMDSPMNNHGNIYEEEDIQELSDNEKNIVRKRNLLLQNGYEFIEMQRGDEVFETVIRSPVIHYVACEFTLTYQKGEHFLVLFQLETEEEDKTNPVQLATIINTGHQLGAFQFIEFIELEEELEEDQDRINEIKINRDFTYKDKPSLEFYKSSDMKINEQLLEKVDALNPEIFEFYNEYVVMELPTDYPIENYDKLFYELSYF